MTNRRSFITGVAAAGTVAISGCSEADLDDIAGNASVENDQEEEGSSSELGPETVVREYFSAISRGDLEAANAQLHPDGEVDETTTERLENLDEIEVSQTEVLEQSEQAANVEFELVVTDEDGTGRSLETAHLRVHDSQWKLYAQRSQDIDEESDNTTGPTPYGGYLRGANNFESVVDRTDAETVTIEVGANSGLSFAPAAVKVSTGTTVLWEWTGRGGQHNVVAESGAFESGYYLEEGSSFQHTFDSLGVYKYHCTPHRTQGMLGVVEVVES